MNASSNRIYTFSHPIPPIGSRFPRFLAHLEHLHLSIAASLDSRLLQA